jgi:hypothetical protein
MNQNNFTVEYIHQIRHKNFEKTKHMKEIILGVAKSLRTAV